MRLVSFHEDQSFAAALKESFFLQHIREVPADHQAGIFAGTNDVIETIGGRPPMSLEAFIEKHRKAFD